MASNAKLCPQCESDDWQYVSIGDFELRVECGTCCERVSFTNLYPVTAVLRQAGRVLLREDASMIGVEPPGDLIGVHINGGMNAEVRRVLKAWRDRVFKGGIEE